MNPQPLPLGPNPSRRAFIIAVPITALGIALTGCSSGSSDKSGSGSPGAAGTTVPTGSTADSSGTQWPMFGHDYAQTRTNVAETTITRENLSKLTRTWEIPDLLGVTGTPTVVDGVAYFGDWKGGVWAVRGDTGVKVWNSTVTGMIPGSAVIDGDGVFVSAGTSVYRFDRATGEQLWKASTDDHPMAQISASPVVVDGIVLQGTASGENMVKKDKYTFRGSMVGFDAKTGERKWVFHVTPNDETAGAGGGIWSTPAIDAGRGLLYVGTGQGLSEPTPPMADSVVALDYRTGKKKWSRQFTSPDVFSAASPGGKDHDVGSSPNLWTSNGRDLVGVADKAGTYHALDRDTGEVVWEIELTPGSVFGGAIGAAAWVDGVIVATSNVGDPATNSPTNVAHVFGLDPATGAQRWVAEEFKGKIFAPVSAIPGVAFCGTDQNKMFALDTQTGKTLWSIDSPGKVGCGPSIVDGRVIWGYGFVLFGPPGPGGIFAMEVKP